MSLEYRQFIEYFNLHRKTRQQLKSELKMYFVQVHKGVSLIIKVFYRFGLWHCGDEPTIKERNLKWFYLIYYSLFPISLIVGGITSGDRDESIFLIGTGTTHVVFSVKLWYIIWKKKDLLELIDRVCAYSVKDREEFNLVNKKLNSLMQFVTVFLPLVYVIIFCAVVIFPFIGSEKALIGNIAFPFDYKNNEIAFWMAYAFVISEAIICSICLLFNVLMWYLLLNCSLQYEVLGHQIRDMGAIKYVASTANKRKISVAEKENVFLCDLEAAISLHQHVQAGINQLASFLSNVFLIQIATSGVCICMSVYCLIFNTNVNFVKYAIYIGVLFYNFFDIFMVMYFGNEIKLSSDDLSYCLFESQWYDKSQATKKIIIVFAELVKKPHELIFGKLYPLTLETFTRILHGAYSMFNILQNLR